MKMMKMTAGLADLQPRGYAIGGLASKDEYSKPAFNPSATFSGSPKGTGLESPNGGFTAATAKVGTSSVQAPRTMSLMEARNNSLSAFLGGNVAPPGPTPDPSTGTPMPKPTFTPAATPTSTNNNGLTTRAPTGTSGPGQLVNEKSAAGAVHGDPLIITPPQHPVKPLTEDVLNAQNDTTKYFMPDGTGGGYGTKLTYDLGQAYRRQLGRAPSEADREALDLLRARLAGGEGLSTLEDALGNTPEGYEYGLVHDPLSDADFARRAYRAYLGRDPDNDGMARMLEQGYGRDQALKFLRDSAEFKARGIPDEEADRLAQDIMGQGDTFEYELGLEENKQMEDALRGTFLARVGREPTDREMAKYAKAIKDGHLQFLGANVNLPNHLYTALDRRKAEGWAKGGRVRKWVGGPLDAPEGFSTGGEVRRPQFFSDGGRVTKRDRFIDEQVNGPAKEPPRAPAPREERVEQTPEEKALLEKYRRKSLAERMKAGLSSLLD